jgi:hypothetical protein
VSVKATLDRNTRRALSDARDNLARAKIAAKSHGPDDEYGKSGRTLGQIIDEYEDEVRLQERALAAIDGAEFD